MKFLRLLALLALTPLVSSAQSSAQPAPDKPGAACACEDCTCTKDGATCACAAESKDAAQPGHGDHAAPAPAPAGHPLRGVIVEVRADRSALLVKHEEIPGVMRAMTMLLKVDAPTLAAAKKDQAITAVLYKQDGAWWLRDVKAEPAK